MSELSLMDYLKSDDFIAGAIAGSIGIVATQPLDTIRIRCQLDKTMNVRQHAMTVKPKPNTFHSHTLIITHFFFSL